MGRRATETVGDHRLAASGGLPGWAGAFLSFLKPRSVNHGEDDPASIVAGLTPPQFEALIAQAYRLQGYTVGRTAGDGASGDLVLTRDGEKFLVHCGQAHAAKVGATAVREFHGAMAGEGAVAGFLLSAGKFTAEAVDYAVGRRVQLVDGPALVELVKAARAAQARAMLLKQLPAASPAQARPAPPPKAPTAVSRQPPRPVAAALPPARPAPAPAPAQARPKDQARAKGQAALPVLRHVAGFMCPLCRAPMVKRQATSGPHAGIQYLGCSAFPACRGVVSLRRLKRA